MPSSVYDPIAGQYINAPPGVDYAVDGTGQVIATYIGSGPGSPGGDSGGSAASAPAAATPSPPPALPTYNIGSGTYNIDPGQINLNDPNQLAATGLTAAQRTTPAYQPLVSGRTTNSGDTVTSDVTADLYNTFKDPQLKPQEQFKYQPIDPNAPGTIQGAAPQVANRANPGAAQAQAGYAPNMNTLAPGSYDPYQLGSAAQGSVNPNSTYSATGIQAAQSGVNPNSTYEAAQAQATQMRNTPEMQVQHQFDMLMHDDQDHNGTPDWAETAVTQSNQRATAMGLGNSTMALSATSTAIFNTALPMAQMNAKTAFDIALTNTNNVQQANLANTAAINASKQYNASVFANTQALNAQLLQQANLANAQYANQAGQYNASVFAQMGLQNLLNQQQTYLSNQAAVNASRQFNAQSAQQNGQFFSSLNAQINGQNADRTTVVSQFNAGQTNALDQFYANMNAQLDQFNAQNRLIVDQSNVQWQRAVNTANTAGVNSANNANAQNMFNLSQSDMNLIWQQARDEASWSLTSAENSQNRLLSLTNSAMNRQTSLEIMRNQQQQAMYSSLGSLATNLFTPVISAGVNSLFGGGGSVPSQDELSGLLGGI